tara:strand:+ start:406 stop:645 length:240 start_codon:yes stop_codon:yes gene_type:complete
MAGEVEKLWNEKKRLRRVEALNTLREEQRQAHKQARIDDAFTRVLNATNKLKDVTLTPEEVQEQIDIITSNQSLINKIK